jgi:hypothetical protein
MYSYSSQKIGDDGYDCLGYSKLHHAAIDGDFEECARLIADGANIEALLHRHSIDETPLYMCCQLNEYTVCAYLLIKAGCKITKHCIREAVRNINPQVLDLMLTYRPSLIGYAKNMLEDVHPSYPCVEFKLNWLKVIDVINGHISALRYHPSKFRSIAVLTGDED